MEFGWSAPFGSMGGGGGVLSPPDPSELLQRLYSNDGTVVLDRLVVATKPDIVDVPVLQLNGTTDYLIDSDITGIETVTSSDGTSTPTVSAGRIDFTAGYIGFLELSNNIKYAFTSTQGQKAWRVDTKALVEFGATINFGNTIQFFS